MSNKGTAMPTRSFSLTPELAEFVSEGVASGDYASGSELVREALRRLKRDREMEKEKLKSLRRETSHGIEQVGFGVFSDQTMAEIAADVLRHWR